MPSHLLRSSDNHRLCESRQRRGLGPGHSYDGVDQHGDEPQLGQHLVVLRGQQGLLAEVRWRERVVTGSAAPTVAQGELGPGRELVLFIVGAAVSDAFAAAWK